MISLQKKIKSYYLIFIILAGKSKASDNFVKICCFILLDILLALIKIIFLLLAKI